MRKRKNLPLLKLVQPHKKWVSTRTSLAPFFVPCLLHLSKSSTPGRWCSFPSCFSQLNPVVFLANKSSSQFIRPLRWCWRALNGHPSITSIFASLNNFHVRNRIPDHSYVLRCCFLIRQKFLFASSPATHENLAAFSVLISLFWVVLSWFRGGELSEVQYSFCQ